MARQRVPVCDQVTKRGLHVTYNNPRRDPELLFDSFDSIEMVQCTLMAWGGLNEAPATQ
jgi:hypothetical protein